MHRMSSHIIKVGLTKAFDMVERNLLIELLEAYDFDPRWFGWVRLILMSSKAKLLS